MSPNQPTENLTDILDALFDSATSERISVKDILKQFEYRGFGSLLLVPTIITLLPTGAIPFVPAICGILMGFICLQMIWGREHPWLPERINNVSISSEKLRDSIQKARPVTKKIDNFLRHRYTPLTHPITKRLTAAISFTLCLGVISIGFIPLLPDALVLPILFFGLGYIARDGLMILIGLLSVGASAGLTWWLITHWERDGFFFFF